MMERISSPILTTLGHMASDIIKRGTTPFFLITLLTAPLSATAETPVKLSIGLGTGIDVLPAFVAEEAGIFAKHGFDVSLIKMATPSVIPSVLIAGSIQIGEATPPNLLFAVDSGLDLVAIEGAAHFEKSQPKVSLVTRPGVTVTNAADLIGKKVGVPGFNSIIDLVLRKWLLDHNVAIKQINLIETPLLSIGDMLKSRQLDAGAPLQPVLGRIVASGSAIKSIDFVSEVAPDMLESFWMVKREWATSHRSDIEAFRAAMADSVAFIKDRPDQAKTIEQKVLGYIYPEEVEYQLKIKPSDFDSMIGIMKQLDMLHQPIDESKLVLE